MFEVQLFDNCYCEILEMEELSKEFEMSEILLVDDLPDNLTYPDSFKKYFEKVKEVKGF